MDPDFLVRGPSAGAALVSIRHVLDRTIGVLSDDLREHLIGVRMHLEYTVHIGSSHGDGGS